ncbi:MAG: hypothetical protein AAB409_06395 [Gemmatimonadota bacterium]
MQVTATARERERGQESARPRAEQPERHFEFPRLLRWLYAARPSLMPTVYVPGPVVVARKV